jgi:hypothetical protein
VSCSVSCVSQSCYMQCASRCHVWCPLSSVFCLVLKFCRYRHKCHHSSHFDCSAVDWTLPMALYTHHSYTCTDTCTCITTLSTGTGPSLGGAAGSLSLGTNGASSSSSTITHTNGTSALSKKDIAALKPMRTYCGHWLHFKCLNDWLTTPPFIR